jgi:hypothetical protein
VKEAIIDGEVVALDTEGWQNFKALMTGRGNLHYAAFDTLWVNGKALRGLPLTRRKRALTGLVPATSTVVFQVFSIEERGRIFSTRCSGSTSRASSPSGRRMPTGRARCGTRSRAGRTPRWRVAGSRSIHSGGRCRIPESPALGDVQRCRGP